MTDQERNGFEFATQYWAWKHRWRTSEPNPEKFGLDLFYAERIALFLHRAFEQDVVHRTLGRAGS